MSTTTEISVNFYIEVDGMCIHCGQTGACVSDAALNQITLPALESTF